MRERIEAFVSKHLAVQGTVEVDVRPIHGGLESAVALAMVRGRGDSPLVPGRFVVKELRAGANREADVYRVLWTHVAEPPSARVLGIDAAGDTRVLYLEEVQPNCEWPWGEPVQAAAVCRELARFHDRAAVPPGALEWDYEGELSRSAAATLDLAMKALDTAGTRIWKRGGDLKRVVGAMPALRARLLAFGTSVIHGDVHPGNVIVCGERVVFIDWSRARVGSPLEDVASWLHSLGCWEPQARRRHDTLLRAYLDARAVPRRVTRELRDAYWCASASNGLAGAIRYHVAILGDRTSDEGAKDRSRIALRAWERVIRRAATLVTTTRDR